jgi:poly(3-hydroxybutyrate) depolymerase/CubicO group peptidase (beta-lactamase class C family)
MPITGAMPHRLPFVAVALCAAVVAQDPDLPGVRELVTAVDGQLGGPGTGLVVWRGADLVHRSLHGGLGGDTVLPIASASKWLAVATVLTLVDEGKLDLDVPVARYLPEFDRADKDRITLRQCLANTSGLPPRLLDRDAGGDSDGFVAAVAQVGVRTQPGSTFRYGGVGFQIAAVAAERVAGRRWHDLFAERIAAPLGMKDTKFGALRPLAAEPGTAKLPWVAGGAVSTLDDYARFLAMLAAKGQFAGRRVLAEASVAAMFRDQVPPHVDVRGAAFAAAGERYGLGTWIETLAPGVARVSDPGAFGFTPWLDLDRGLAGVLAVRDRAQRVLPQLRRVQDAVRDAAVDPAVVGTATTVELDHGGRDRRYHLHVPPHAANIAGMPLLVVLHGGGGSGEQAREATGLAEAGVRAGFAVAFPDGTGPLRSKLLTWNSGNLAVYATEHDVDDVAFLRAVVTDVQRRVPIDAKAVFAAGHSNGGMMCHRLAREAADVFAGIAVVAGTIAATEVDADTPIAALLVHGTADGHVRIDGGRPRDALGRVGDRSDAPLQDVVDYYVARNRLSGYAESKVDGKVRIDSYTAAKAGAEAAQPLRVVTLDGGGHAWPGSRAKAHRRGDEPFPFDASAAILAFFRELAPHRPASASPAGR